MFKFFPLKLVLISFIFLNAAHASKHEKMRPDFLQKTFKKTSKNYGRCFSHFGAIEDKIIEFVKEKDGDNCTVLNKACGYGRLPWELFNQTDSCVIVANDLVTDHLAGLRKWRKSKNNRKRIKVFSGDCVKMLETKAYIDQVGDVNYDVISGFNYLHFLHPSECARHLLTDAKLLKSGGRAFYLMNSSNVAPDDAVVSAFKNPALYSQQILWMNANGSLVNQGRLCVIAELISYYRTNGESLPGFLDFSFMPKLKKFFDRDCMVTLGEEDVKLFAKRLGLKLIYMKSFGASMETGEFKLKKDGPYLGFIFEKPENAPECTKTVEELFPEYVDISKSRKKFHQRHPVEVIKKYPFVKITDTGENDNNENE